MADTSAVNSAASSTASSVTSRATIAQNFDTFLQLLTTQLKNQNPLDPMNDTEFVSQMAQFSILEQVSLIAEEIEGLREDIAKGLEQINEAVSALGEKADASDLTAVSEALGLLGKRVKARVEESVIEGVVESVKDLSTWPKLLAAGSEFYLSDVLEVLS